LWDNCPQLSYPVRMLKNARVGKCNQQGAGAAFRRPNPLSLCAAKRQLGQVSYASFSPVTATLRMK